jgi:hypothetical protein
MKTNFNCIKIVDISVVRNFAIGNILTWDCLRIQIIVLGCHVKFKTLNLLSILGCRHALYISYSARRDVKLYDCQFFIWGHLKA